MADTLRRSEAIQALRGKILELVDDEHSMCRVAAERGIYCHGFRRHSDEELRERYDWLVRRRPGLDRAQLEKMANEWELARQVVDRVPVSCDAQALEQDTCSGWDGFDNGTLAAYCLELLDREVDVVDD